MIMKFNRNLYFSCTYSQIMILTLDKINSKNNILYIFPFLIEYCIQNCYFYFAMLLE